jgi:hypothetical protein
MASNERAASSRITSDGNWQSMAELGFGFFFQISGSTRPEVVEFDAALISEPSRDVQFKWWRQSDRSKHGW